VVANASCGIRMSSWVKAITAPFVAMFGFEPQNSDSDSTGMYTASWELADSLPSLLDESAGRNGAICRMTGSWTLLKLVLSYLWFKSFELIY
jgi:hypothetical protein